MAPPCCPGTAPSCPTRPRLPRSTWITANNAWTRCGPRWSSSVPDATARQVVELVYADVDRSLWPAAEWSVRAQLDYLRS